MVRDAMPEPFSNPSAAMPDNAPGRWRGMCWRAARAAALVYLGVLLVLSMLQTWLIFPGAATQGRTDAIVPPMPGTELTRIQRPEGEIAVLFGSPIGQHDPDQPRPTVLFFYGNGMCMADAIGEFNALRRRGANVVLADYCGYGMSGGEPGEG